MIVAGDAAGLLEPWTREGISFALRSGAWAGTAAARAARSALGLHAFQGFCSGDLTFDRLYSHGIFRMFLKMLAGEMGTGHR